MTKRALITGITGQDGSYGSADKFPLSGRRIFVAGHRGMVGSALIRRLAQEQCRILTVGRDTVELQDQASVTQ